MHSGFFLDSDSHVSQRHALVTEFPGLISFKTPQTLKERLIFLAVKLILTMFKLTNLEDLGFLLFSFRFCLLKLRPIFIQSQIPFAL